MPNSIFHHVVVARHARGRYRLRNLSTGKADPRFFGSEAAAWQTFVRECAPDARDWEYVEMLAYIRDQGGRCPTSEFRQRYRDTDAKAWLDGAKSAGLLKKRRTSRDCLRWDVTEHGKAICELLKYREAVVSG